jgi:hypothetical protein
MSRLRQYVNVARKRMTAAISYEDSCEYIADIKFDYVEIYSMMRGEDYAKSQEALENEHNKLKNGEKTKTLTNDEQLRLTELDELVGRTQYLINSRGARHSSSVLTNTFRGNDPEVVRIIDILRTPVRDLPHWMCAPEYRDAIVFYDKLGKSVSTLNVCLSCLYMETEPGKYINADNSTCQKLREFFISVGHDVESD